MPRLFASDDDRDLVRAERDVRAAFTGLDLDLTSLSAVSNIFRAATAVRNHMESGVLAQHELSWSAFTTLFVLRVWGEMDARSLASEAGVTAATLTGVMKTLEARQLLRRKNDRADGRRVLVGSRRRAARWSTRSCPPSTATKAWSRRRSPKKNRSSWPTRCAPSCAPSKPSTCNPSERFLSRWLPSACPFDEPQERRVD